MPFTRCPHCGFANLEGRALCTSCGLPLDPPRTVADAGEEPSPAAASRYEYLVVPFVGQASTEFLSIENANSVTKQLQETIDRYVEQGWDYYRMEKVNIQVPTALLQAVKGSISATTFDQIIFRRERIET